MSEDLTYERMRAIAAQAARSVASAPSIDPASAASLGRRLTPRRVFRVVAKPPTEQDRWLAQQGAWAAFAPAIRRAVDVAAVALPMRPAVASEDPAVVEAWVAGQIEKRERYKLALADQIAKEA